MVQPAAAFAEQSPCGAITCCGVPYSVHSMTGAAILEDLDPLYLHAGVSAAPAAPIIIPPVHIIQHREMLMILCIARSHRR